MNKRTQWTARRYVRMGFRRNGGEATKITGPNPNSRQPLLTTKDILGLVILHEPILASDWQRDSVLDARPETGIQGGPKFWIVNRELPDLKVDGGETRELSTLQAAVLPSEQTKVQEGRTGKVSMGFRENAGEPMKTTGPNPNLRQAELMTNDILGLVISHEPISARTAR